MSGLLPNTTQIPDVILDQWMPHLTGAELKVVLYVCRRTYGFRKNQDTISLKQMVEGIKKHDGTVLDHGTGLSASTVKEACKSLEKKRVLNRNQRRSKATGDTPTAYSLNLDRVPAQGGGQKSATGWPKTGQGGGQKSATQHPVLQQEKDLSKDKSKEETSLPPPKKLKANRQDNECKWEALLESDPDAKVLREFAIFLAGKNASGEKTLSALWNQLGRPFTESVEKHGRAATIVGLKTAMEAGKRSFPYAKGVARDWTPDNVRTLERKPRRDSIAVIGATDEDYSEESYGW